MSEAIFLLAVFCCALLAGILSRWGPLSGWAALVFPLLVPPVGFGLTLAFC
jgi:hypothetical protein